MNVRKCAQWLLGSSHSRKSIDDHRGPQRCQSTQSQLRRQFLQSGVFDTRIISLLVLSLRPGYSRSQWTIPVIGCERESEQRVPDRREAVCVSRIFLDITMSLDGFVAAPNVGVSRPLGDEGECLHNWLFGDGTILPTDDDREVVQEMFTRTGAFVMGRRTFDVGEGPWGNDGAFRVPCFVLTHRARATLVKGPTTFTFITAGLDKCLEEAKAAAGERDVCVMGGAEIAQQCLRARIVDEMRLHLAPMLLSSGTRLFDHIGPKRLGLERTRVIESPLATHLTFRVVK
jgi:dihydrofolate reductase